MGQGVRGLIRNSLQIKTHTPTSQKVFETYLTQLGWTKNKQPRKKDNTKYKLTEFLKSQAKHGTFIVSLSGHLTMTQDGKIIDTWDCGDLCVGNYWTK